MDIAIVGKNAFGSGAPLKGGEIGQTVGAVNASQTDFQSPPRVLAAVDFSPRSMAAVDFARGLVHSSDAGFTLLHVLDPSEGDGRPAAEFATRGFEALQHLNEWVGRLRSAGIPAVGILVEGVPAEEILRLASDYGTVVLGEPAKARWWRLFSKRTALEVAAAIPTKVILARPVRASPPPDTRSAEAPVTVQAAA